MNKEADRGLTVLLTAYAAAVLLLVCVSARLWWQSPLALIPYEFDYFLGLFAHTNLVLFAKWLILGRGLHALGFVIVGCLYLGVVRKLVQSPLALSERSIAAWAIVVSLIFAVGMPWVSPDVFFYIGTGWVESHYGLSPYLTSITAVPGFEHDEMFSNIFPGFLGGTTSYGPLFQKLAELLSALSGGNEKLALALHKAAGLALHAGCSALVWRLAPAPFRRVALFSYAANPLICFSVLTCAHNDHWMNLFVLLALLAAGWRYWLLAGVALGAAFGIKYFPLVFVPVFGLAALVQLRENGGAARNWVDAAKLTAGFAIAVVLVYLPYPDSHQAFSNVAVSSISIYRNCVYYFIDVLTVYVLPALFKVPAVLATYQNVGVLLRFAYIAVYGIMLLALIDRLRRDTVRGIAEACLAAIVLYFILVDTTNQEWYLTWLMGFALVLPYNRAHTLAWGLSASFLPFVIFTVKNPAPIWFMANVALYCLLLILGGQYLVRLARSLRPSAGPQQPDTEQGI
jgi:alpha-1,6-mannosyltransferase